MPNTRLHRAPISPAAGRTCPALHCGTVALTCAAQVLALFLSRNEVRPAACAPFHPCCAHPTPKQLQVPWWPRSQPLLAFHASTFPCHTRRSLWPRRHGFGARLALRAPSVRTRELRMHPGWVLPRTDGNQRAVSTTCRTGGVQFAFQMTNAEACRVAPHLRQYLARGVGFWWHKIRRYGSAGNCRIKHDRGFCRVHELFALPRLVFVRPCGVYTR